MKGLPANMPEPTNRASRWDGDVSCLLLVYSVVCSQGSSFPFTANMLCSKTRGDVGPSRSILTPGFKPPPRLHPTFHGQIDILGHCNQIQQRTLFRGLTGFHARGLPSPCFCFPIQQELIFQHVPSHASPKKQRPTEWNQWGADV